jgi:hypothetical protein
MKSKPTRKSTKAKQSVLVNVARTIGSTLGTLAAKATTAAKDLPGHVSPRITTSKGRKARSNHSA